MKSTNRTYQTERKATALTRQRWAGRREPAALCARRLALAVCLIGPIPTGFAQTIPQFTVQKLLPPSDVAGYDFFGSTISILNDRALVGRSDADYAPTPVYVYERDGTGTWVEVAELMASDGIDDEGYSLVNFGSSVALSGDLALVGAIDGGGAVDNSGSAYLFEQDRTGTWGEVAKLTASDAATEDNFGNSVALSDDRLLIGTASSDDSGSAYVFEQDVTGAWVEVAKLTASDAGAVDFFGSSVSLSGDRALVGAYRDDDAGELSGSAYLFERDRAGTWVQVAKLTASDAQAEDYFGLAVALEGDRAVISALRDDNNGGAKAGSAYIYELDGAGTWGEVAKLTASDAAARDEFGSAIALSGDRVLVGSNRDDDAGSKSGSAYVYERNGAGMWEELAKLTAPDAATGDQFGTSLALSGTNALVGAPRTTDNSRHYSRPRFGSVYVFDVPDISDMDQDGVVDAQDNCPADINPLQENFDEDLLGDACDLDDDNDGVDDTSDPYPLDPTRPGAGGLPALSLNIVDRNQYGFRFEGIDSHREFLEFNFNASNADLLLTLNGYDIDSGKEVRVLINGTSIGFLSRTSNNGLGTSELIIERSLLDSSGNTLRMEQRNPGWKWGVTDLLLSETGDPGDQPTLILDSVDSGLYGFRFDGADDNRESLERQFDASGSDLVLTLTGYDIDIRQEVRVLVNGTPIGFLSRTPNNGRGASQLTIARSLLNSTGNKLSIEQLRPGWKWGVTDLLLSEGGA